MAQFMVLLNFTEKGIQGILQTVERAEAFANAARQAGASVTSQYWSMGAYDGVMILDAPDDRAAASLMAKLGSQGNVRTQTIRLFDRTEIQSILAKAR